MARQYIHLARAMELIEIRGKNIFLTELGLISRYFSDRQNLSVSLAIPECIYILAILLYSDGYMIGYVIDQLHRFPGISIGEHIRHFYKDCVQEKENQTYLKIEFDHYGSILKKQGLFGMTRQLPERVGEDILPPRINWLIDLGLESYVGNTANRFHTQTARYFLTKTGKQLYDAILKQHLFDYIEQPHHYLDSEYLRILEEMRWLSAKDSQLRYIVELIGREVGRWK